jgi:DNA-directed RNA polymerases I and III subunit RPAC1
LEAHCEKGVGKDHAKFSPVATASYRLLPHIEIQPMGQSESKQLVGMCPMKVFDIEDVGAVVSRPRDCSVCRECIRLEGWSEKVKLSRVPDHFIFKVRFAWILSQQFPILILLLMF